MDLEDYERHPEELRAIAYAWIAGYACAMGGKIPSTPFLTMAAQVMPPQILDEAIEHYGMELVWLPNNFTYFQVAPPRQ